MIHQATLKEPESEIPTSPLASRLIRVVVDTETTGLAHNASPPRPDGIVSVGLAWRDPTISTQGVFTTEFEANPGEEFYANGRADAAFKVNGFTADRVRRSAPATAAAEMLRSKLRALVAEFGGVELVAFNDAFDRPLVEADPWKVSSVSGVTWGPDIADRAKKVMRYANGHMKLDACLSYFKIERPGKAHTAAADCHAELLLAEALDHAETVAVERHDLRDVALDIEHYIKAHWSPPKTPREVSDPDPPDLDYIAASQLDKCPLEEWMTFHGGVPKDWSTWSMTKGALADDRESFIIEVMTDAGIHVFDRQKFVKDKETGVGGKIDGRFSWPIGSDTVYPFDVKSVSKNLNSASSEPEQRTVYQMEVYLRAMGYARGFFIYTGLGFREIGQWTFTPYELNDETWESVKRRVAEIKMLRRPETEKPNCRCGWCHQREKTQ